MLETAPRETRGIGARADFLNPTPSLPLCRSSRKSSSGRAAAAPPPFLSCLCAHDSGVDGGAAPSPPWSDRGARPPQMQARGGHPWSKQREKKKEGQSGGGFARL